MRKEIVLPPHLYDRIKASAGEHGGIGWGRLFSDGLSLEGYGSTGTPFCAHGHAWGTCTRYLAERLRNKDDWMCEPELQRYLHWSENDSALEWEVDHDETRRVPFERWCDLLNVKRGAEPPRDDLLIKQLEKSVEMTQREPINA